MKFQTYGDPQQISAWQRAPVSALIAEFAAAAGRRDQLDLARHELREQLQAKRSAQGLSPIKGYPLEPVRKRQASDILECMRPNPWDLIPRNLDLTQVLQTHLALGTVTRHRVIGAFVVLESMIRSIMAETNALDGKWYRVDGKWDPNQGNIGEVMNSLDSVLAPEASS